MRSLRRTMLGLVLATGLLPAASFAQQPNPLEGLDFYVDEESPAWQQWETYQRTGQTRKADLIWKIAREPKALWLGRSRGRTSRSRCAA